jgi:phosphatidylinositol glycan class N
MAPFPRVRFLAIAVVFHLVYVYSIFDIYFVSPIVSGMRLFQVDRPQGTRAPADRLVLFVGKFVFPRMPEEEDILLGWEL